MKRWLKAIAVITIFLGVLVAGCSAETSQPLIQNPWIGKPAPDFEFQDVDGQSTSLSDLQGKGVFINFWTVRCPTCRAQMPYIQQVYEDWADKELVILSINVGDSSSQVAGFMGSAGFSFPVLLDMRRGIAQLYGIRYFPSTFFIDKDGIIQHMTVVPFQSKAGVEARLREIVP